MKTPRLLPAGLFCLLLCPIFFPALEAENDPSVRDGLSQVGRLFLTMFGQPGGPAWGPFEEAKAAVLKAPKQAIQETIDSVLKDGAQEERIGAFTVLESLVYLKREPPDPSRATVLLALLEADDLRSHAYTTTLTGALLLYPSREAVSAFMARAVRSQDSEARAILEGAAANLVRVELDIHEGTLPMYIEKQLVEFEAWYAKNKDRISFTRDGKLRLSGGKPPEVEKAELTAEDRARVRENALCVLQLMSLTLSDTADEEESNAKATALNAKCGPALFGAERSALMGKMASAASGDSGPPLEMEAELQGPSGYPMADAALLAAATVAATEKDPAALRLAEATLARAPRAEVRRACKGEPSSVRKKAESLAGGKE